MQTKQQIRQLLESAGVRPNKRLGQHYLIDLNLMRLLIESAAITRKDTVLEVGCGTGSLTEAIAEKAGFCAAVEIDDTTVQIAREQLGGADNIEIIHGDILKTKNVLSPKVVEVLQRRCKGLGGRLLLVSNLPYNVAAAVMINLVTGPAAADGMYVTVQKEVAERMVASPGGSEYGTLSIYLNATGEVGIIRILKPTVFWPQPQVDSAMVGFVRNEEKARRIRDMKLFVRVVSLFFGHRRKMVKSCIKFADGRLKDIDDWTEIFAKASVEANSRPEELGSGQYVAMANLCSERLEEKGRDAYERDE